MKLITIIVPLLLLPLFFVRDKMGLVDEKLGKGRPVRNLTKRNILLLINVGMWILVLFSPWVLIAMVPINIGLIYLLTY